MTPSRRPGTTDPHRSRERALKVLYQADLRGMAPVEWLASVVDDEQASALLDDVDDPDQVANLATRVEEARQRGTSDVDGYARALVVGVGDHIEDLDELIEGFAERWTLVRMAAIDRNVLRLAAYELLHEDTPPAVVIDEALLLVKDLSTENSVRFVNGILESIRKQDAAEAPA